MLRAAPLSPHELDPSDLSKATRLVDALSPLTIKRWLFGIGKRALTTLIYLPGTDYACINGTVLLLLGHLVENTRARGGPGSQCRNIITSVRSQAHTRACQLSVQVA